MGNFMKEDSASNIQKLIARSEPDEIADLLRLHGVAVLPGYLHKTAINGMQHELRRLAEDYGGEVVIDRPYLMTKRIRQEWLKQGWLTTYMEDPLFATVCRRYFRESYRLPTKHYYTVSHGGSDEKELPYRLHFDDMRFLKFFVYLTDVKREDGPIWVQPGTHHVNSEYHDEQIQAGRSHAEINTHPKAMGPPKRLEGPAGTVIIFTTDVTHRAGTVYDRHRRLAFQTLVATERDLAWRNYGDPHP